MTASKVRLAICGLGREAKPRLKGLFDSTDRFELRWLVDENVAHASRVLSKILPDPRHTEVTKPWMWDKICSDKELDAVLICSPNPGVNTVRKTLRNGKAVMCEYPVSLHKAALMACYEESQFSKRPLFFSFNRRFERLTRYIHDIVRSGQIGTVYNIRMASCYEPKQMYGILENNEAIFRNIVTQEIDTITWILGESPSSVFATGTGLMSEDQMGIKDTSMHDAISMTMRFPRGTLATMEIVEKEGGPGEQYEISGSHGMILVDPHHPIGTAVHAVTMAGTKTKIIEDSIPERQEEAFINATNHFLDVLHGEGETVQVDAVDVVRATNTALACMASHLSNISIARDTRRSVKRPEALLKEPLWQESPRLMTDFGGQI